jgi:hypothetical protein
MKIPNNETTKFEGLGSYKALMLEYPILEVWLKRYVKLANCFIDTKVPKAVLLAALKQQFVPASVSTSVKKLDRQYIDEFAQHIEDTNNFLLPIVHSDGTTQAPVLYAVPPLDFKDTKVISMAEALFINVPWWEPDEIRMLKFENSEPSLIWTHSKNNDFTFVGDHTHFRHAAPRENLIAYELIYVR